jgi:hypothetical protein
MTNQQKINKLKKIYGSDVVIAEAFVRLLKITKSDKLYPSAVEWVITQILDEKNDSLTKREKQQFERDNKEKKLGPVHKKIIKEIKTLYQINLVLDGKDEIKTSKIDQTVQAAPQPSPLPDLKPDKIDPPEVTLESNVRRVPKGGSVSLTWTSKNAKKIKRTNIPGITSKTPLNGTIEVDDIRKRRDFYIIVEGPGGTSEAKVRTLIETQQFLKGKEKDEEDPDSFEPEVNKRKTLVNLLSPSTKIKGKDDPVVKSSTSSTSSLDLGILTSISKSILNISKILSTYLKYRKRQSDIERRGGELRIRQLKEDNMEQPNSGDGLSSLKSGAEKIISPFKAIIDKIINFVFYTFLGKAFTDIVNWLNDPENKEKVESMGKFLKDFWPLILGSLLLFFTPLFGFIVGTIQVLSWGVKSLKGLKGLIDRLIFKKGAKPGPKTSAKPGSGTKVTTGSGGTKAPPKVGGGRNITGDVLKGGSKLPRLGNIRGGGLLTPLMILAQLFEEPLKGGVGKLYESLGIVEKGKSKENIEKSRKIFDSNYRPNFYEFGGEIFSGLVKKTDGISVSGAGSDTQAFPVLGGGMAILQPGEIVLNKQGVKNAMKLGIDPLELNTGPGSNKPKSLKGSKIKLMNTGGIIGQKNVGDNTRKSTVNTSNVLMQFNKVNSNTSSTGKQNIANRMPLVTSSTGKQNYVGRKTDPMINSQPKSMMSRRNDTSPVIKNQFSFSPISQNINKNMRGSNVTQHFGSNNIQVLSPQFEKQSSSLGVNKSLETMMTGQKINVIRPQGTVNNNFKANYKNRTNIPKPLSNNSSRFSTITLPPIVQNSQPISSSSGSGTPLPVFSATPSGTGEIRMGMASIYGIIV